MTSTRITASFPHTRRVPGVYGLATAGGDGHDRFLPADAAGIFGDAGQRLDGEVGADGCRARRAGDYIELQGDLDGTVIGVRAHDADAGRRGPNEGVHLVH